MEEKIKLLTQLREKQDKIKAVILNLEAEIISDIPDLKLEGTTKQPWGSVTTKLTRKLDYEAYKKNVKTLPEKQQFVTLTPKIDLKIMRLALLVNSDIVTSCITIKPAKPIIKINEVGNEF